MREYSWPSLTNLSKTRCRKLLTVDQVAELLTLSPKYVRDLLRAGDIKGKRLQLPGGRQGKWLIERDRLMPLIQGRE